MPIHTESAASVRDDTTASMSSRTGTEQELLQRVIWGGALALLTFAAVLLGGYYFVAFIIVVMALALQEWQQMIASLSVKWRVIGVVYFSAPVLSLLYLNQQRAENAVPEALLLCFLLVWASDIGAYITGKMIGKTPLCPQVSPGKTKEGSAGGILASVLVALIAFWSIALPSSIMQAILIGLLVSVATQVGDLFISFMKRQANIKDTSNLIPGHGGALDRIDGLLLAVPVFTLYLLVQ